MIQYDSRKIGNIATVTSSKRIFLSDYVDSGVPFWRSKEVIEQFRGNEISNELFISIKRYSDIKKKFGVPTAGDILITSVGTIGIPYLVKENDVFYFKDGNLTWIKNIEDDVEPKYLFKWLVSPLGAGVINNYLIGSSQKALTIESLKKIPVPLPPLPTQQKIAHILSAYDDLIENNLKRIKLLEEMAQITYEQWFVRMKFPGHDATPIDAETGLPEGWWEASLGDMTDYVNRGIAPKYVEKDGLPVINQKCIRNKYVNFDEARLTSSSKKIHEDKVLRKYDILINSTGTGTLGRVAQVMIEPNKSTVDTHVTIVRASDNFSALYLGRALESLEPFIVSLGKGATNQQELGRTDLSQIIRIVVPARELQEQFESMLSPLYRAISSYREQNQLLKEARDILLPRLMTGMIDMDHIELPAAQPKSAAA